MEDTMSKIHIGKEAEEMLNDLLTFKGDNDPSYPPPYEKGVFKQNDVYIAFDNTQGECFTEEFKSIPDALNWLKEYEENEVSITLSESDYRLMIEILSDSLDNINLSTQHRKSLRIMLERMEVKN